jgi:hypothetical protein
VEERHWSRGQIYRARIIAYQLGAVLARLAVREAQDRPPERSPTLDEVVWMRSQGA